MGAVDSEGSKGWQPNLSKRPCEFGLLSTDGSNELSLVVAVNNPFSIRVLRKTRTLVGRVRHGARDVLAPLASGVSLADSHFASGELCGALKGHFAEGGQK
jgi:hypothetical protein